ncbi:SprT-like family-domain-containing protein [Cladochytrium replicatum]|nr:SprT-like family-domain-containing protein [Cladochytrium replicatum]
MHNTKSIEGKRRLRAIYVSSDDELSPVKRVDRPKLQPSSVQKRVDAAKNIHHPAVSSHPTVSTPHNILLDPAVPPARKGRPKISDQELNSTTPVPVRNPPKSVWSPEDRPAAVPSTPKTVKRKLFVSSTATTGTANREHLSYKKERETIAIQLYKEFNEIVFGSLLPDDLEISWSAKLVATAGISRLVTRKNTKTGTVTRKATIELSNKVLDTKERLRSTLAHEMCHIAAFWIDGITKPPHGAVFKKWGQKVMRCYSDIEVTTCHSYEIAYTHWYECENMFCGRRYGRFSKSIDVQSQRCGICGGKLRYLDRNCKDGKPRKENLFQAFLKERLKPTKEIFPGLPHKEVMRILSDEWKEVKSSWIAGREGLQTAKDAVPPTYGGDDLGVEEDDDDDESSEEDLSFVVPDEESIDQE